MPKIIREMFATIHGSKDDLSQLVEISRDGVVRIDPNKLVKTDKVQDQIRLLDRLIKDGQVEITRTPRS